MLKKLPEFLGESSFLGLVLAGTAVVVLAPAAKKVVRGVAISAAKGVLSLSEGGASLASNVKSEWDEIVAEAKTQKESTATDTGTLVGAGTGGALGASLGGMAGPVGAAVGGGLGGIAGASVGSGMTQEPKTANNKTNHKEKH
ncbi:MAG: hypothetical protein ACYCV0_02755 [Desulfitobacteriaceae bacterium]